MDAKIQQCMFIANIKQDLRLHSHVSGSVTLPVYHAHHLKAPFTHALFNVILR